MYAVIETGGKQYKVAEGQTVRLEKLPEEVGKKVNFDKILLVGGDNVKIGQPYVKDSQVQGEIVTHGRGKKVRIVKFRRRKHSRTQMGHRQDYTEVKIEKIQ